MSFDLENATLEEKLKAGPKNVPDNAPLEPLQPSGVQARFQKSEETSIYDWLKTFSGNSAVKISLVRISPEQWDGYQTAGLIDTFDELIEEDEIKRRFGGGKYQLKVQVQHNNGRWNYAGARTFKIAGDPIILGDMHRRRRDDDEVVAIGPDTDTVKTALLMSRDLVKDAQDRAERVEARAANISPGLSENMVQLITKPLELQVLSLTTQLSEKDRIIADKDRIINELTAKKPDTTVQDTLLGKMFDNESSRLEAIRIQHESERRQLMESQKEEVRRVQDRADYDIKRMDDSHKRELQNLRDSLDSRIESIKSGYEGRIEAKDNRIKDLDRDLNKAVVEIGELRAKKEKGLMETIKEATVMKNELGVLFGSNDDAEEPSVMDKFVSMAEPLIKGIGARMEAGPPQPQQRQLPQPVRRVVKVKKEVPTQPAVPAAPEPAKLTPGSLDPGQVAMAVSYIENAMLTQSPQAVAADVRRSVPSDVMNVLRTKGVDSFLDEVAAPYINADSPLATQTGRIFIRSMVKYLLSETTN